MNNAAIGVFDSGLGGLTAVKELQRILPHENIVYFGDTARVPYGNRNRKTLINFARQDVAFLLSKNVKALVAACGTVSSTLPDEVVEGFPVPFYGIIYAAVRAAAAASKNGHVGVIATESAIATGCYQASIASVNKNITVTTNPCPLFVPLVEYGHFATNDAMARLAVEEYLAPVRSAGVDTLIMGCTHYPLLANAIANFMGKDVTLIDPGKITALRIKSKLSQKGLLNGQKKTGSVAFYVSAGAPRFNTLASLFLGQSVHGKVHEIDIDNY